MEQGSVKNAFLVLGRPFDMDPAQIVLPDITGGPYHLVKIPMRNFVRHIFTGLFDTDKGAGHLHLYHLLFLGLKADVGPHTCTLLLRFRHIDLRFVPEGIPSSEVFYFAVDLNNKIPFEVGQFRS